MVKPRVFVSSTYLDLKPIREALGKFIDGLGFESVIFEEGHIAHIPGNYVDLSCLLEIKNCHIVVLLIGGRYGSPSSESENEENDETNKYESITVTEFQTAHNRKIPIYIFIEKDVLTAYKIYQHNKDTLIKYPDVDNIQIFDFIEKVYTPNIYWIKAFDKTEDIISELRNQWAGLFANYLINLQYEEQLKTISGQTEEMYKVLETLKSYSESILKNVTNADEYGRISNKTEKKDIEDRLELFYIPAQNAIMIAEKFMNTFQNFSGNLDVWHEICKHERGYEHQDMTLFERASIYVAEELKLISKYRFRAKEDTRKAFEKFVYEEESEENYSELSRLIKRDIEDYQGKLSDL
jgi:hypothetical protein